MKTIQAILTRRSIRKYTDQLVSEVMVDQLLRCAMSAPSAGREEPWHFVVIRDKRVMEEIMAVHQYSRMLSEANVAIIVCGDLTKQKYPDYWVQGCAAATENMLLAAHDMGLGAVWLGVYPTEDRVENIRKIMGTPDNIVPFSIVSLGYPAQEFAPTERYDKSRIHSNRW